MMFSDNQIRKAICGFSRSEGGLNVAGIKKLLHQTYHLTDAQTEGKLRKHLAEQLMNSYFKLEPVIPSNSQTVDSKKYTEKDTITFNHPKKQWGQLSNNFIYPFKFEGVTGKSAEHHFQSTKFRYPESGQAEQKYEKIILATTTGNKAKMLGNQEKIETGYESKWFDYREGKKVKLNDLIEENKTAVPNEDWLEIEEETMKAILKSKFSHQELQNVLLSTGQAQLVYKSKSDDRWGDSTDDETGENLLGEMLMEIRTELQENQKK